MIFTGNSYVNICTTKYQIFDKRIPIFHDSQMKRSSTFVVLMIDINSSLLDQINKNNRNIIRISLSLDRGKTTDG
jgi:hypothetical protein